MMDLILRCRQSQKRAGLNYELCLSMGTIAGFVGVAMMLVIAKFRDRFGGRKVSAALFVVFGLTYYFCSCVRQIL